MSQASAVAAPGVLGPGVRGFKPEMDRLRELARRVLCDASHLSKVVHGRKGPSPRQAARLDDALEAAGELVILAAAVEAAPDDAAGQAHDPRGRAADGQAVTGEGMTLTLPYVPARLVIEMAGPAGLAEGGGGAAAAPGRLALVRGGAPQAEGSEAG